MNHKNNMLALSQERFSARKFTPEAVSQEDLDYIMECVRLAPSALQKQRLWQKSVLNSPRNTRVTKAAVSSILMSEDTRLYLCSR